MQYTNAPEKHDLIGLAHNAAQKRAFDGRLPGLHVLQVTNTDDPLKLNRIKGRLQWMNEDGTLYETGWVKQGTLHPGPTDLNRGVIFGLDMPAPEVHSNVFVFFNGGNPHDAYYFGAPRYRENDRGVPRIEKDDKRQFCFRWRFANGTEFGIGTEGDAYAIINGHFRLKIQGSFLVSARGMLSIISTKMRLAALSVIRKVAPQLSEAHYIRDEDDPGLREEFIDAMSGAPGKQDPGIREPKDLT